MASTGCKVSLFERDKVIYELLKDGLEDMRPRILMGRRSQKGFKLRIETF